MDLGLKGRRALVLGGNRGIGYGIARELAIEGADVVIAARDAARLRQAETDLAAVAAGAVASAELDLADTAALPQFVEDVTTRIGPVDILINNTGGPPYGPALGRSAEDWQESFQAMVMSIINLTDALVPGMRRRTWGRIVTVVSSGVIQPIPILAISNSLRAAVVGWSKTLSGELAADGITANILVPGRIDTERVRLTDEAVAEREGLSVEAVRVRSTATIPLGRYGTPAEIGAAVAFLCSRQAAYITGTMMRVDGGIVRSW